MVWILLFSPAIGIALSLWLFNRNTSIAHHEYEKGQRIQSLKYYQIDRVWFYTEKTKGPYIFHNDGAYEESYSPNKGYTYRLVGMYYRSYNIRISVAVGLTIFIIALIISLVREGY